MSVLICENISKSFKVGDKQIQVLKDINISFPDIGLVSIIGKSGCGKSTLLNILMGIERPTKGRILFNNKDISRYSDKQFSKYHLNDVSLIFQHYNLFDNLSSLSNVLLPLKMRGENNQEAKEKAYSLFKQFKLEYLVNRKVKTLSGGEKQRVSIIRSLITNPKVIFCDEPTGALDSKNSLEIMKILKDISSKILVIVVSHNTKLVNKFSDQIILLKNMGIAEISYKNVNKIERNLEVQKSKYSSNWTTIFLKQNLISNFKKNVFSIISCIVSFTAMIVSIGFINGARKSENEALKRTLELGYAKVSESTSIEIEGSPLSFEKTTKPNITNIDSLFNNLESLNVEENLSYFISSYPKCFFNGKQISNFEMIPCSDESLKNISDIAPYTGVNVDLSFNDIVINEEFAKLLDSDCINQYLNIQNSSQTSFTTGNKENPFIKDIFQYNQVFRIAGIVKEFPFLNTPKIYYSHSGAKKFLKASTMENLSNYLGKRYTFYNYLINCDDDDPVSSYSSLIFINNLNEIDKFFTILKTNSSSLSIESTPFSISETYSSFIESFSTALIVFVVIAFLGVNFIMGMISLSTFIQNKKNTAVLTCLGARNSSIHSIYLIENFFIVFISYLFALLISLLFKDKLNTFILTKFSLNNIIDIPISSLFGIPYFILLAIFIVVCVSSSIFTLTPMIIYRNTSIADELRDE